MSVRAPERAGYTTNVFILDCSASMSDVVPDPELDRDTASLAADGPTAVFGDASGPPAMKSKLQWAKEYVCRKILEQASYGRKTEHCLVVATGDRTNNPYEGYDAIDVVFPSYMASPWMVGRVQNVRAGEGPGDVLAGMSIALSTLQDSPHEMKKPSWTTNFHILTDGQSQLPDADTQIKSLVPGLRFFNNKSLLIVGYGFQDKKWARLGGTFPEAPDPELLEENEAILRSFSRACRAEANCADSGTISLSLALTFVRAPQLRTVKPTAKAMPLRIAVDVFADRDSNEGFKSLTIPVKVAKMTDASTALKKPKTKPVFVTPVQPNSPERESASLARRGGVDVRKREETLKVALATSGVDISESLEGPALVHELERIGGEGLKAFNQEQASLVEQLRALAAPDHVASVDGPKLWNVVATDLQATHVYTERPAESGPDGSGSDAPAHTLDEPEPVLPEDVSRGHRFGSGWIPVEMDVETGKPVKMGAFQTEMGIDICKFIPALSFDREMEMGELRYIFADPKSAKSQIELSALIRAMVDHPAGQMLAVMRFVYNVDSAPFMVVARGVKDDGGDHLECVRVPFQDDYRRHYFPSLEFPKTDRGDLVTEHSTLPTSEQKRVMGELIDKSILNTLGEGGTPWYSPELSYNPSIHTLKAFQQHQVLASPSDPAPPIHSYLTRYFKPPAEVTTATRALGKRVAEAFDLRPVPVKKTAKRKDNSAVAEEDPIDIFELFGPTSFANQEVSSPGSPIPSTSKLPPKSGDDSVTESEAEPEPADSSRIVERADKALGMFRKAWQTSDGSGDTVETAIESLGKEIRSLVDKGSKDQALRCVAEMRRECLKGEEAPAFNDFLRSLKSHVRAGSATEFWSFFQAKGGRSAGLLTFKDDAEFELSVVTPAEADEFLGDL